MFAADSHLQLPPGLAPPLSAQAHQLAGSLLVEGLERIGLQDALVHIQGKKLAGVVPAVTEGQLRQVVGTETEELGHNGEAVGDQGGARYLDHSADRILDPPPQLAPRRHLGGDAIDHLLQIGQLANGSHEGDHYLRQSPNFPFADIRRRFDDSLRLHLVDLGEGDAEATAAVAEHGVELVQRVDLGLDHPDG